MSILQSIQRWLRRSRGNGRQWRELQHWAEDRQYDWRQARGEQGFVMDGRMGNLPWRLEWGPSQRAYIDGAELRLRTDVAVPPELQALVLNKRLQERLEREVFEHYVGDLQTRLDTRTPPEVRWLVLYSPMAPQEPRRLKERWAAVSNVKPWLEQWLASSFAQALAAVDGDPAAPVVLMVARSRLTLRVSLAQPHPQAIEGWLHLFEQAVREARRIGATGCDTSDPDPTEPGLFTPSPTLEEPADAH